MLACSVEANLLRWGESGTLSRSPHQTTLPHWRQHGQGSGCGARRRRRATIFVFDYVFECEKRDETEGGRRRQNLNFWRRKTAMWHAAVRLTRPLNRGRDWTLPPVLNRTCGYKNVGLAVLPRGARTGGQARGEKRRRAAKRKSFRNASLHSLVRCFLFGWSSLKRSLVSLLVPFFWRLGC
jgi:hypothetical protein